MARHQRMTVGIMIILIVLTLFGCKAASDKPSVQAPLPETTYAAKENQVATPIPAAEAFAGGNGTQEDPYQIATAEQLALLAKYVNEKNIEFAKAHYVQIEDIVMNDTSDLENWDTQAPEWSWTPIGMQYLSEFQGYYNGAGYSISGMYLHFVDDEKTEDRYIKIGLFGAIYEATVENVTLRDSYVYTAGANAAGGIIGDASFSSVGNCSNSATVATLDTYRVGGVCGEGGNETVFDNCQNTGSVYAEGAGATGGICGSARVSVTNSSNTGSITANGYVGGICGDAPALIENCHNSGAIVNVKDSGMLNAGGIAGLSTKEIRNCHNTGTVSGDTYVGGIVGSFGNIPGLEGKTGTATLTQCANEGTITGVHTVGGIVGNATIYNGDLTVSDCTNSGAVSGSGDSSGVGGIAGVLFGMGECKNGNGLVIENCHNTGSVTHGYSAGGIAGESSISKAPAIIQNCSNAGVITSSSEITDWTAGVPSGGGILGQICPGKELQTILNCVNNGTIQAAIHGGGIVGTYFGGNLNVEKADEVLLSQCVNNSAVSSQNTGGIVGAGMGHVATCRIEDCVNEGVVSGEDGYGIGGILGVDISMRTAGGNDPFFYIARCVNLGTVQYGEGGLLFDANLSNLDYQPTQDDKLEILIGGKSLGGIAGGVFQSIIEDCVNCGEILAPEDTMFILSDSKCAMRKGQTEGKKLLAGAICGMYYFRDNIHTAKNMGIRNCTYADSVCAGYSEFALFEGGHTIKDLRMVSENQAMELTKELTLWKN